MRWSDGHCVVSAPARFVDGRNRVRVSARFRFVPLEPPFSFGCVDPQQAFLGLFFALLSVLELRCELQLEKGFATRTSSRLARGQELLNVAIRRDEQQERCGGRLSSPSSGGRHGDAGSAMRVVSNQRAKLEPSVVRPILTVRAHENEKFCAIRFRKSTGARRLTVPTETIRDSKMVFGCNAP